MTTTMDASRSAAFEPRMAGRLGTGTAAPGWDMALERRVDDGKGLADALGWFSIGLGAAELLAPEAVAEYLGMDDLTELVRAYGLREIATGVGILANRQPTGWVWARVAGDALDLATLAAGLSPRNRRRNRVLGAMAAVAGVALLDVMCARQLDQPRVQH